MRTNTNSTDTNSTDSRLLIEDISSPLEPIDDVENVQNKETSSLPSWANVKNLKTAAFITIEGLGLIVVSFQPFINNYDSSATCIKVTGCGLELTKMIGENPARASLIISGMLSIFFTYAFQLKEGTINARDYVLDSQTKWQMALKVLAITGITSLTVTREVLNGITLGQSSLVIAGNAFSGMPTGIFAGANITKKFIAMLTALWQAYSQRDFSIFKSSESLWTNIARGIGFSAGSVLAVPFILGTADNTYKFTYKLPSLALSIPATALLSLGVAYNCLTFIAGVLHDVCKAIALKLQGQPNPSAVARQHPYLLGMLLGLVVLLSSLSYSQQSTILLKDIAIKPQNRFNRALDHDWMIYGIIASSILFHIGALSNLTFMLIQRFGPPISRATTYLSGSLTLFASKQEPTSGKHDAFYRPLAYSSIR